MPICNTNRRQVGRQVQQFAARISGSVTAFLFTYKSMVEDGYAFTTLRQTDMRASF